MFALKTNVKTDVAEQSPLYRIVWVANSHAKQKTSKQID